MSLIQHVENYLGSIDKGWKDNDSEQNLQVVYFPDCPGETISTFLSLGMSDHVLELNNFKRVRQELVFSIYTVSSSELVVSFLMSLCEAVVNRGKAVLRGEVIPLTSELAQKIGFKFVYCTIPIFFDEDFCSYDSTTPPTVMVWVIPIYDAEADYIKEYGWESFEDLLEEKDPDLCSLERSLVI